MPPNINRDSLLALLDSAESPEDIEQIAALLDELENSSTAKPVDRFTVSTLSEVAEFFGLNVQTVKQWRMESPPMPGGEGAYSLREVVKWRHNKLTNSDVKTAKQEVELQLSRILVEQKLIELGKDKGELLDRGDVERWAATALIECREMIMSLPEMLASSADATLRDFTRSESDRHCRDVLTALRRRLESYEIESHEVSATAGQGIV